MKYKLIYRLTGGIVFIISLFVLLSTMQPSVSFWDCGEFTAAAFSLQIPHPPGTPLFSILGRIFSMLPVGNNIAYRINLLSVLASAFSVLFLYLITVKLIRNYSKNEPRSLTEALSVYIAAGIGALSFSFSDTFWFNGVEAEVYASSTFLFSAITYLMMLWNERANEKDNEKYILLIAYLVGLSTGVHLMSVLAIVSVVMVIMFKKFVKDYEVLKKSAYILLAHSAAILTAAIIVWNSQKGISPPSLEEYLSFDTQFKLIIAVLSILIILLTWKKIINRNSIYLAIISGGAALFITYPGIVKILPGIIASLSGDSEEIAVALFVLIFVLLGYAAYVSYKNSRQTLHLVFMSFIFILLGFSTYTMIIIRSNQNPPMNENQPTEFSQLISYLNREQYGDFPIFMRRFSVEPKHAGIYVNYKNDMDFLWKYQMNHMMTRYLLWNFAGRENWNQDAGVNIAPFNEIAKPVGRFFNISFGGESKDSLFAIPFILGLLGAVYHFKRDWKMALVFIVLFILMGYLTAFYQNQQQPQPRERDYFYVGAFFIFSIWITLGIRWMIDAAKKLKNSKIKNASIGMILAVAIIFVPLRMLQANYFTHNRSQNWFPWDFAYNLLQSCAPGAVLFTNGDNDTFPLWYMQDVEGIRRDIKIVNLSLLNTPWYISQIKNNDAYDVGKIDMRLTDFQIKNIRPIEWEPQEITIPFPVLKNYSERRDLIRQFGLEGADSAGMEEIKFTMNSTLNYGNVKGIRVQDVIVKEIVENNIWKRPIYFAFTVPDDGKIGLNSYLRIEGLAYRLIPHRSERPDLQINEPLMKRMLLVKNSTFSKTYRPNFIFRGLNNPEIFFDENQTRMIHYYRNAYLSLAYSYLYNNQKDMALKAMDAMMETIPDGSAKIEFPMLFEISNIYYNSGDGAKFKKFSREAEIKALERLEKNPSDVQSYYNPYRILIGIYDKQKDFKKLYGIWEKIFKMYPNDPAVKANLDRYKKLASGTDSSSVE